MGFVVNHFRGTDPNSRPGASSGVRTKTRRRSDSRVDSSSMHATGSDYGKQWPLERSAGAVRAMLTSFSGRFEPPQDSEQPLHQAALKSVQCRLVEIRTVAGPSSARQCVLSGGPYTVSSRVRHCCARFRAQASLVTHWDGAGPRGCPYGHRVGGCVVHSPLVVCTTRPAPLRAYARAPLPETEQVVGYSLPSRGRGRQFP